MSRTAQPEPRPTQQTQRSEAARAQRTAPRRRAGPRRSWLVGAAAALVVLAVTIILPVWLRPGADTGSGSTADPGGIPAGQGQNLGSAPAYRLTDQLGHAVDSHRFAGKVQVVTFLFPYCTTYCPIIARNLVLLRQRLTTAGLGDRVELVAFNVDPQGAGPAQMRTFWSEFGGNPNDPGFEFLTGTPQQIQGVVRDGFHIDYQKVAGGDESGGGAASGSPPPPNPLADHAKVNYDVQHNDFVEIVDGHGRIVRLYDSGSEVTPDQMFRAARAAGA